MDKKAKFEQGARVGLKSGGPVMTISKVIGKDKVEVIWFDTVNQLHEAELPKKMLNLLEADQDYLDVLEMQRLQRQGQLAGLRQQMSAVREKNMNIVRPSGQA